jgi:hypothetical protein
LLKWIQPVFRPLVVYHRTILLTLLLIVFIPLFGFGFKKLIWEETPIPSEVQNITESQLVLQKKVGAKLGERILFQEEEQKGIKSPKLMETGSVVVKSNPLNAQLEASYLDKKKVGKGEIHLQNLPIGTEVLVYASLANYEPIEKKIYIQTGGTPSEYPLNLEKKPPGFGRLRVNAVPWGRVTMSGFISGKETPVIRNGIPEGKYLVKVINPALNKTLTSVAVLRGGKTTHCDADFEGSGKMKCR